ncbi:MAG: bifunctional riboflavin kinase/FMN adenylyltransferase [Oscillospiraceae bacterium]|nr:bifunctional riboflavin kinase/FMN adenylyltransferase [Oscillospiraceae bacterium]
MQTVIALGFFDGVHLGHGDLLARTAAVAAERGWRSAALTFDRSPGKDGRLLSTVEDRIRLIRGLYGLEDVFVLPFSEEFMHLPWQAFLELLVREHGAAHLVCGWDYRFGYLGAGNAGTLRGWCAAHGLGCDVIPPRVIDGVTVSSTYLKTLIEAGETEAAIRYYGHPHTMCGTVQPGRHLGRTLGFPTANLLPPPELVLPRDGVYAVRATLGEPGGQAMLVPTENAGAVAHNVRRYKGVCNVGTRPTVGGHRRTVETWLEGFEGDLYGRELTLEFFRFLRPEQSFPDLEALRAQVERDKTAALSYFHQTRG